MFGGINSLQACYFYIDNMYGNKINAATPTTVVEFCLCLFVSQSFGFYANSLRDVVGVGFHYKINVNQRQGLALSYLWLK